MRATVGMGNSRAEILIRERRNRKRPRKRSRCGGCASSDGGASLLQTAPVLPGLAKPVAGPWSRHGRPQDRPGTCASGLLKEERGRMQPKDAWQPICVFGISRGELQERAAWGVQRGWHGGSRASTPGAGDQSRCRRGGASPPQQLPQWYSRP